MTHGMVANLIDADDAVSTSAVTFDPVTVSNVTLSNGNLTATNTGTTGTNQGAHVYFSHAHSTGKYYFEIQWTNFGAANSFGAGIGFTVATYSGLSVNGVGGAISYLGSIWVNGVIKLGSFLATTSGDVIAFAVDLDNLGFWVKNATTGGQWNASGTANPATNTGGIAIPSGSYVPFSVFGGAGGAAGEIQTANFGASAFVGAVPGGFTAGWAP